MNAITELYRLPETKQQQESFRDAILTEIFNGDADVIKVEIQMKIVADTLEMVRKDARFKNMLINEVEKHGKEGLQVAGATIKMKGRSTIDFSNDDECNRLTAELKARQTLLKELGHIPETGEALITKYSEFTEIKY